MSEKSYINWHSMSDLAIEEHIGAFIRHHRLKQNKTQAFVAKAAGISRSTLSLLERGETPSFKTLIQVMRVLDLLYILDAFRIHKEISPIALAKLEQQVRERASTYKTKSSSKKESDW